MFASKPKRVRRKTTHFQYEAQDKKHRLKVEFCYNVLDTCQSIQKRFEQLKWLNSTFGFLYDIHKLLNEVETRETIMDNCVNLEKSQQHDNSKDSETTDLCSELQALAHLLPKRLQPKDVLQFVCANGPVESLPNVFYFFN